MMRSLWVSKKTYFWNRGYVTLHTDTYLHKKGQPNKHAHWMNRHAKWSEKWSVGSKQSSWNQAGVYAWTNDAGFSWTLTFKRVKGGKAKYTVGKDCPYYASGHTVATLYEDDEGVAILGPWEEPYQKQSGTRRMPHNPCLISCLYRGRIHKGFFFVWYCGLYRVHPHIPLLNLPLLGLAVIGVNTSKSEFCALLSFCVS